jgi:hypothetical protein
VILGNAMAGERHIFTTLRIMFPEFAKALANARSFRDLPAEVRAAIERDALSEVAQAVREGALPGSPATGLPAGV